MNKAKYYVIHNGDGDTHVEEMSGETLKKRLSEGYWGPVEFLGDIDGTDTNYWGGKLLIIKGNILVPEVIQTVTEYKID